MKIYIEKTDKLIGLKGIRDGKELLEKLDINPQTVILTKNDEVILEDEELSESDEIKILSVISGG